MPGWRSHSCEEAALEQVEAAEKLVNLYGYWPSFHDAHLETITIAVEENTVTISFTTNDSVEKAGEPVRDELALVTLRWEEVSELNIQASDWGGQSWVWDMLLTVAETGIRTEIQSGDELRAVIVASRVKVVEVRPVDGQLAASA
jgi:hypothetical protein